MNTNLFIHDMEEYRIYLEYIKNNTTIDFHTYTPKHLLQHAFILRGIGSEPDREEIKRELKEKHGLTIHNIFKLKNTRRVLYMVIVNNNITQKHLTKNIKFVYHTKITWERRFNAPEIVQCRRCQAWGHGAINCRSTPACL